MSSLSNIQKRTGWKGDLASLLAKLCRDYNLGNYIQHETIPVGIEDCNVVLNSETGRYLIKVFAKYRDIENCKRYVEIMHRAIAAGVKHPMLIQSSQGNLYVTQMDGIDIRLCVMQYINGKSLYELNAKISLEDVPFFAHQAALINSIDFIPSAVYDSWAIVNLLTEYEKKKQYLDEQDRTLIEPICQQFLSLNVENLPHCLVHGDIIKTNVLKVEQGNFYVLDFSVANYYPRVQELAVLLCNILFDEDSPHSFTRYYNLLLREYERHIPLVGKEISALPTFTHTAHAMHIICASYEKYANGMNTAEISYWLNLGKAGLSYTTQLWS